VTCDMLVTKKVERSVLLHHNDKRWLLYKYSLSRHHRYLKITVHPVHHLVRKYLVCDLFWWKGQQSYHYSLPKFRYIAPHPSGYRTLLPVGPAYLTHLRLSLHHGHSFSSLDKHLEAERERLAVLHGDDAVGEDDLGVGDEEEPQELLNLDPKEWKVRSTDF